MNRWSVAALSVAALVAFVWYQLCGIDSQTHELAPQAGGADAEANSDLSASVVEVDKSIAGDLAPDVVSQSASAQRQHADWVRAIVATLIRQGDPESLVGAALLMRSNAAYFAQPPENRTAYLQRYLDLIKRAASQSPSDATIQWIALTVCQGSAALAPDCDPQVYDEALRALDPDNAASWLGALQQSIALRDDKGQTYALERMESAKRIDDYDSEIKALTARAIESARVTPPSASADSRSRPTEALIAGATRNLPRPPITPLLKVCGPVAKSATPPQCRHVAELMQTTDNTGTIEYGLSMARMLVPGESPEARRIAEVQRRLLWQVEQAMELVHAGNQRVELMAAINDRRQMEDLLRDNGVSLDPPAEWKPTR